MQGKTHISIGIAASLAVLQPHVAPAVICTAVGGALGGWIIDVDVRNNDNKRDVAESFLVLVVVVALLLGLDYLFKLGVNDYIASNINQFSAIGAAAFLALTIVGVRQNHRCFTHSFVGIVLWTVAAYVAFPPIAPAFAIGAIAHVVLDLANKQEVQLFLPFTSKGFCFGWCESSSKASVVLGVVGLISSLALAIWLFASSLPGNEGVSGFIEDLTSNPGVFGLNGFQLYLIGINLFTLVFCWLDRIRFALSSDESVLDTIFTFIDNALALAGGALGLLLALITTSAVDKRSGASKNMARRGEDGNAVWYVYAICLVLVWAVIYCFVQGLLPGLSGASLDGDPRSHMPLLAYLAIINIVTFILFYRDSETDRRKFSAFELFLMGLALIGGAAGALLAMAVTSSKEKTYHMSIGIPIMLAANIAIVAMLLINGIA